jgi:hypothetical protein
MPCQPEHAAIAQAHIWGRAELGTGHPSTDPAFEPDRVHRLIFGSDQSRVTRYDIESERPFDDVIAAYEARVGTADHGELTDGLLSAKSKEDWEALCNSLFGSSALAYLNNETLDAKARKLDEKLLAFAEEITGGKA